MKKTCGNCAEPIFSNHTLWCLTIGDYVHWDDSPEKHNCRFWTPLDKQSEVEYEDMEVQGLFKD